ncbi:formate hydrogenlyase complex iron-sulfur subunit [Ferrimonas balearica]|uniref:formate hydrogenlyase complex iron-sulfur subunit n=1 Tax=Ferrimonas balearica TaxID=44012 RepID=UPI001C93F8E5|nr:formate hydrogenlyase complex iron-sulfur subunit [Ferrimonas balearica]MBY5979435.1 4Fe-4S dicluster domain-containing protein [Ferrimonas balearica]
MLKLFKTIKNAGQSTTRYPFEPYVPCDDFRGKPEYQAKDCISCAACTRACPANALTMESNEQAGTRQWRLSIGRCIFCGRCEEVCPTGAIRLSQEFELAVATKSDLQQTAIFRLQRCRCCDAFFAPRKAVEHAYDLLVQAGVSASELKHTKVVLETCPECRRRNNMLDSEGLVFAEKRLKEGSHERN